MNATLKSMGCSRTRLPWMKSSAENLVFTAKRGHTMHKELSAEGVKYQPWYKYGVACLVLEMAIAIAVCGYSLFLTFPRFHSAFFPFK